MIKMAYMNQEKKSNIATLLKAVVPKGWKYTLSVKHYSTIIMTIQSAPVDLLSLNNGSNSINEYYPENHFSGETLETIKTIIAVLNTDNHNRSDIMSDYHDVGHYISLKIGKREKPFMLMAA